MDPNANIAEQREIAQRLADGQIGRTSETVALAERLAELVLALDEWRKTGGFDPYPSPMGKSLREEVKDALEGDSNDAEHDALVSVAEAFEIAYDADDFGPVHEPSPDPDWMNP